jgi:FkbM family methyltransferase
MVKAIRSFARRTLPDRIRKPLGNLLGPVEHKVVQPIEGMIFDLKGGLFRTDGCVFSVPRHLTTRAYRACFLRGDYEEEERALIKRFVRADDKVLECGACLGVVSCVTNQLLRDKTRHVVVEANPKVIPSLYKNRELNKAGFLIEHCAISDKTEETFYLHPVYIVGGTSQRKSPEAVRLPGRSLLDLEARYGPFTTLIIDIEGSELDVFERSRDILRKLRLVIAELHPWAIGESAVQRCRDILSEAGLRHAESAGLTEAWQRD